MEVRHEYEDGKMYYYTEIKKMRNNTHRSVKSGAGEEGYWKPTQSGKPIEDSSSSATIGSKTPLVFYQYYPTKKKTDWHMYEYKLPESYYQNCSSSHLVLAVIYQHPPPPPPPPPTSELSIMAATTIV